MGVPRCNPLVVWWEEAVHPKRAVALSSTGCIDARRVPVDCPIHAWCMHGAGRAAGRREACHCMRAMPPQYAQFGTVASAAQHT